MRTHPGQTYSTGSISTGRSLKYGNYVSKAALKAAYRSLLPTRLMAKKDLSLMQEIEIPAPY